MPDEASPLRVALEQRLGTYGPLTALLGTRTHGVYHRRAPQPAKPPVVIFDKRSGVTTWAFGRPAFFTETWMVRGVAFGRTADRAEAIAKQIDECLTDQPLVILGHTLLLLRKDSDVDFPEQVGKEIFQHVGGIYRVIYEPV